MKNLVKFYYCFCKNVIFFSRFKFNIKMVAKGKDIAEEKKRVEQVKQRYESYRDRLSAIICDIFHSMFYCVQVLYTTNQETSVFRDI